MPNGLVDRTKEILKLNGRSPAYKCDSFWSAPVDNNYVLYTDMSANREDVTYRVY